MLVVLPLASLIQDQLTIHHVYLPINLYFCHQITHDMFIAQGGITVVVSSLVSLIQDQVTKQHVYLPINLHIYHLSYV